MNETVQFDLTAATMAAVAMSALPVVANADHAPLEGGAGIVSGTS